MGGRGTFSVGNNVPYTYKTIGKIDGIKVLKGTGTKHGLPEESHSSNAYIGLNPNGDVKKIRIYNTNHTAKTDVEYSMHQGKISLHIHDYIDGVRQPARALNSDEATIYSKYFGGIK